MIKPNSFEHMKKQRLGFLHKMAECSRNKLSSKNPNELARGRGAFTLIELLVVVSIIVVLAAFLLPALKSVLNQGSKSQSLANLHHLAAGVMAYTGDHDGQFPRHLLLDGGGQTVPCPDPRMPGNKIYVYGVMGDGGFVQSWQDQIYPYVPSAKIFTSPSMKLKNMPWPGYGLNSDLTGEMQFHRDWSVTYRESPRKIGSIQRPSQLIMMCELITSYNYLFGSLVSSAASSSAWPDTFIYAKGDGIFAFADGHVETRNRTDTMVTSGNFSPNYRAELQ
jgi:prepilin-type N-terminal cleavage/methylation domain-containing protein/prepilin-type processing-associated H-X9-DG protein